VKLASGSGIRGIAVAIAIGASGCSLMQRPPTPTELDDVVFYCDGAGGGGPLTDWGTGVQKGLAEDGYEGEFRNFRWQTGLGALADQNTSVSFKRGKARELAGLMQQHWRKFPGGSVHLIGLSAGSAIAIFSLEELPKGLQADNVILLGSSLSADYDLTPALRHVRGEVHVFTSERDAVLGLLVPLTGSADRRFVGTRLAGRYGFQMPPNASDDVQQLYSKVVNVQWDSARRAEGDRGGHTAATNPAFVRAYIAPIINRDGPRRMVISDSTTN
jgi:hypothetical protein